MELTVTVSGKTPAELKTKLEEAAKAAAKWTGAGATAAGKPTTKKAKAEEEFEEETLEAEGEEEESFDDAEEETEVEEEELEEEELEEEEEAPKKSAKGKKLTEKDVNAACMAYAKKHDRKAALEILKKKFKVKSILELKPEQYADVMKALKV